MAKHGWLARAATALLAQSLPSLGAEPTYAAPGPNVGGAATCPSCAASYAVTGSCGDCPKHGRRGNSCDGGEGKLSRCLNWLFYIPQRGCFGICCNGTIRPQVPFYAYFPCHAGCGSACAACNSAHAYHSVNLAGGETQSSGTSASPVRISTYKPNVIATQMPVLAPDQFKQRPPKNACEACRR